MRKLLTLFPVLALVFVAACDEDASQTASDEERRKDPYFKAETVVGANAPWPPNEMIETVEEFDPDRTRTNLQVVIDFSGSMDGTSCAGEYATKAHAARAAFATWLSNVPEEANVGLIIFESGTTDIVVPLGRGNANREALLQAIQDTHPAGGTPLSTAVELAHAELTRQAAYQQGYGNYRLVVITDGEHSENYDPTNAVAEILLNPANPIEIHTIGFCIKDSALNVSGKTFYQSANNPEELAAGLESVLAESETFSAAGFEALGEEAQ